MNILLKDYTNYQLQDVINSAPDHAIIELEGKLYQESLQIDKPLTFKGTENTILDLDQDSIQFLCEDMLVIEDLEIQIKANKDFPAIYVKNGTAMLRNCRILCSSQIQEIYSCIWVEEGSFYLNDTFVEVSCDLLKCINGQDIKIDKCDLKLTGGKDVFIESHGMSYLQLTRNTIEIDHDFIRATKTNDFLFEDNNVTIKKGSRFLIVDGILTSGEVFDIKDNRFYLEKNMFISISNCQSANRKVLIYKNLVMEDMTGKAQCLISGIHGTVLIDENHLQDILISKCSEIIFRRNRLEHMSIELIEQVIGIKNRIKGNILIRGIQYLDLKKNYFDNVNHDGEAIELSEIQKVIFEENHVSSVDHGLTLHNSGDCITIRVMHNEFKSCKKRGLNIVSSFQKKYLKSDIEISKNIFIKNEKAIFVDDRNLKTCQLSENFFDDNLEAIHITGGKQTHTLKIEGNYIGKNQLLSLRSSGVLLLQSNRMIECPMSIRGIDDISITANHFEIEQVKVTTPHEIAIKLGGSLMVRHNIFSGKLRNEKKDLTKRLNITAYERLPSIVLKNNFGQQGKKALPILEVPDTSLIYTLRHLQDDQGEGIDHVLENEFLEVREALISLKKKLINEHFKKLLMEIIDQFQIRLLSNKSSNEIYRFIVRANEMKEMLKIYIQMAGELEQATESRILDIMNNFLAFLQETSDENFDGEKDKLKAQMKLMEKLL